MTISEKKYGKINYLETLPDGFDAKKKYPLIFFLHGAGTRGSDLNLLRENLFYKIALKYDKTEYITVAPQCKAGGTWFDVFSELIEFLEYAASSENVDESRVYGMGNSMGGYGIWQLAMSCPGRFAGIVPICGGGQYWNAGTLKNVPVWAFHGDSDTTVDKSESVKMVEAVNAFGGNAKLTLYENTDHDAWTPTYENPEVFDWLLSLSKKGGEGYVDSFTDSKKFG